MLQTANWIRHFKLYCFIHSSLYCFIRTELLPLCIDWIGASTWKVASFLLCLPVFCVSCLFSGVSLDNFEDLNQLSYCKSHTGVLWNESSFFFYSLEWVRRRIKQFISFDTLFDPINRENLPWIKSIQLLINIFHAESTDLICKFIDFTVHAASIAFN